MPRRAHFAVTLAVIGFPASLVQAEVTLQVLATDPTSPAVLSKWHKFYIRVSYATDRRIFVRARPFFAGKSVPAMTSGAMPHDAGIGEAFYWISYIDPRKVDSIVVTAEEGRTTYAQVSIPVDLTWTGEASSTPQVSADWAERMQAGQNRMVEAQSKAYNERTPGLFEDMPFFAAAWSVPAYFAIQAWLLWRLRGGWRKAAAIPLLPMLAVLVYTIYAALAGGNLFPIVLIFTAPPAFLYLLAVLLLHRVTQKPAPQPGQG